MSDTESRAVKIHIPNPKIYATKTLHNNIPKVTKRSSKKTAAVSTKVSAKYIIPVIKPLSAAGFQKYYIIAPYARFMRIQEKERRQKLMAVNIREKYQINYQDLRRRLHTDDPLDDCKAVTDFDPEFFKCVDGALLPSQIASFKSLKVLINNRLRTKQEIGYRKDCMLNIEMNKKHERKVNEETVKRYAEQVKYLDEFISYDYQKSMVSLKKWDLMKAAVNNKINEFQCLGSKEFTLISKIIGLEYRYGLQQKYGRFLYYLSPPSWRLKHRDFARSVEIEEKGFDFGSCGEEDKFNVVFEKLKQEIDCGLTKPVLYFKQPHDLIDILESFEKQNLHHFCHVFQNTSHTIFLNKGIKLFKDIIKCESADLVKYIHEFEKFIQFYENHSNQLVTKFYQILHGVFYKSVGTLEVLKFQTHLEFCYERVFNETPINMDMVAVAKAIEESYMNYSKRLDSITSNKITSAVMQYQQAERQKYINAKKASRELRMFERLEQKLLLAYKPTTAQVPQPLPVAPRQSVLRKTLLKKTKSKHDYSRKSLTESELEYLRLFTDWTDNEDPAKYLLPY